MKQIIVMLIVTAAAAGREARYFESRDAYIAKFKKTQPTDPEARAALKDLEKQLHALIAPPKPASINLETLTEDGGFGQADGLQYAKASDEHVFVTTKKLLEHYVASRKYLPKSLARLAETPVFYSRVFSWDAAFTNFAELPVKNGRAFLTLRAQDIGPFPPETLILFAEKGDKIYLDDIEVAGVTKPIASCQTVWDEVEAKAAAMKASALEEAHKLEEKGFESFRECYSKTVKSEAFYKTLVDKSQAAIDGLP